MTVTASRVALYEGLIALAWIDHDLDASEKAALHAQIDSNLYFDEDQRARLHADVDRPVALADVWPRLTDPQDRARLVDWADELIRADGSLDDREQDAEAWMLDRLLGALDRDAIGRDLASVSADLREKARDEAADLRRYRAKFSMVAAIGRMFGQANGADTA